LRFAAHGQAGEKVVEITQRPRVLVIAVDQKEPNPFFG
jgi:hypothetical protein